ncbi:MAG: hypothetical protein K2M79_03640 [Muribaculaceae bacterium]|nr:hypothetical protein [Muribaculaceae bacterium]
MRKIACALSGITLIFLFSLCLISCGSETSGKNIDTILSVDSVLAQPEQLLNDTLRISGICVSPESGFNDREIYLKGESGKFLRCVATQEMGTFNGDCVGHQMVVKGLLCQTLKGKKEIKNETKALIRRDTTGKKKDSIILPGGDTLNMQAEDTLVKEGYSIAETYYLSVTEFEVKE